MHEHAGYQPMKVKSSSTLRLFILLAVLLPTQTISGSQAQIPQTDGLARATTVALTARGPDGAALPLSRASLHLDIWGDGKLVSLPIDRNAATLHLDQQWLCSAWNILCQNRQYGPARIILESDGFAPITASVYWPGQKRTGETVAARSAGIYFSPNRDVRIEEGTSQQLDVAFRRIIPRTLQIVDEAGLPAADIRLDSWLFYGATNHTGTIEGEILAKGRTDANGRFSIPDIDGELAIELNRGHYVLKNPDPVSPFRAIIKPENSPPATITLTIHRFKSQVLRLNVANPNGSAAGLTLGGCDTFCSGACCGDLAVTDANGQIRLDNFYAEESDSLYIADKSGNVLWRGSPAILNNSTGVPTITLR